MEHPLTPSHRRQRMGFVWRTVKGVAQTAFFGALTALMGVFAMDMWINDSALIERGVIVDGVVVGYDGLKYRDYIVAYNTVDGAPARRELSVRIFPFAPEPAVGDLRRVVYDPENPYVATLSPPRRARVLGPLAAAALGAWATRDAVRGSWRVRRLEERERPSVRLVEQRMRNHAMEALEDLSAGDAGVRTVGLVAYVEQLSDALSDDSPWHWREWSCFTTDEVEALDQVLQLLNAACAATRDVGTEDEFIASGWPTRLQPPAARALDLMRARGRFREDVEEDRPSAT